MASDTVDEIGARLFKVSEDLWGYVHLPPEYAPLSPSFTKVGYRLAVSRLVRLPETGRSRRAELCLLSAGDFEQCTARDNNVRSQLQAFGRHRRRDTAVDRHRCCAREAGDLS